MSLIIVASLMGLADGAEAQQADAPQTELPPPAAEQSDGQATDDNEPDADDQPAKEADVGDNEEKSSSEDDVMLQLDRSSERFLEQGPDEFLYPAWEEFNDKLDKEIGLRLGFTYFALFQYTTPGPDRRNASAGNLDFFGRWTLLQGAERARGTLGFNLTYRHAYTDIAPTALNKEFGSIYGTARGFNDSGFNFNELWWDQRLADDRVSFRIGTINQKHGFDLYSFKSQKRYFLSTPFSDTPTIAFPRNGFGARVRLSPVKEFHITAGMSDANGDRSVGGVDNFFSDGQFFTALDLAYTPTIEGLGDGRYSLTPWHTDASSDRNRPSGKGISALLEQEVAKGVVPFLRYGYGDGAALNVQQYAAIGVGIEKPFERVDDVFGVGVNWARPPGGNSRDQWGLEVFYRFQLSHTFQLTPGFQLVVDPSRDPSEDAVGVFQLRLGLIF